MVTRISQEKLDELLAQFPAVALLGPRQCGKTMLALTVTEGRADAVYLDLETPSDARKLDDAEDFFARHADELVVLDEIQRKPELFPVLRGVIDRNRRRGRAAGPFLLLGPASLDLPRQSSESLAGRLARLELTPLLACEARAARLPAPALWVRGGFPESFLAADDAASLRWRHEFIRTYLERDIPAFGPRIPAETLRRLWTMLAHSQGAPLNAAALAGALGVSGRTVARYIDLLVDLLLVRRLQLWGGNTKKRLVRSPKTYVRDSGVAHALLGLETADDILGHPVAGASWEGWVIENLLAALPAGAAASYYRTGAGAEIDLVLELRRGVRWAVEIKRSTAPAVSKGFYIGCADIRAARKIVVYSGDENYGLGDGVEAVTPGALEDESRAFAG
jgi:predicted AAA+ superfamily ATPase